MKRLPLLLSIGIMLLTVACGSQTQDNLLEAPSSLESITNDSNTDTLVDGAGGEVSAGAASESATVRQAANSAASDSSDVAQTAPDNEVAASAPSAGVGAGPQIESVASESSEVAQADPGNGAASADSSEQAASGPPPAQPTPTASGDPVQAAGDVAVAASEPVTDPQGRVRVIITLKDPVGVSAAGGVRVNAVAAAQANVRAAFSNDDLTVSHEFSHVPAMVGYASPAAIAALERNPNVLSVTPDTVVTVTLAQAGPLVNADDLHLAGFTGAGVRVAVIDTGIDTDHADLSDDLVAQKCFLLAGGCPGGGTESSNAEDGHGHGTHVSGIITGKGVVAPLGIAPDAEIIAIKVLSDLGSGYLSDTTRALDWLVANHSSGLNLQTDAINMSLGGSTQYFSSASCDFSNASEKTAIDLLRALGVTTFVATGNDGWTNAVSAPGCLSNVVGVGASDDSDGMTSFSNRDTAGMTDIFAPGLWITSSMTGGGMATWSGTSMATPVVAGVAALLYEVNPSISPTDLIDAMITSTSATINDAGGSGGIFPRVDALTAFNVVAPCVVANVTEIPAAECEDLAALYTSTGGDSWTDNTGWWADSTPCSSGVWSGLTCTGAGPYNISGIDLSSNNLTGTVHYAALSGLWSLTTLDLSSNNLSGNIPFMQNSVETVNLANNMLSGDLLYLWYFGANITSLDLSNNAFVGEMASVTYLSALALVTLDIAYNGVTPSPNTTAFLNSKDPDWLSTQNIAPTGIAATGAGYDSIGLSWIPITYTGDGGYYEVNYSTTSGGPWTVAGNTASKSTTSYSVGSLNGNTLYYFTLRTYTPAHGSQTNNLWSDYSTEFTYSTLCASVQDIPVSECNALVSLYDSSTGSSWTTDTDWLATDTACSWYGVTCGGNQVTGLALPNNNLSNAALDLSAFTGLTTLDLSDNGLTTFPTLPSTVTVLDLSGNALSSLPTLPTGLTTLDLGSNLFAGVFPDLSALTGLTTLDLSNNGFVGNVPSSIESVTGLTTTDIGYNALTATSAATAIFLDAEDPDWASTQTGPPTGLASGAVTSTSIDLSWTAIPYTTDGGYYEVSYALAPGGPWTVSGNTADKSATSYTVTGLPINKTVYFRLRTYTPSHGNQQSNLWSAYSGSFTGDTDPIMNFGDVSAISPAFADLGGGNYEVTVTVTGVYPVSCGRSPTVIQEMNTPSANHVTVTFFKIVPPNKACSASTQSFSIDIVLTGTYGTGTTWFLHVNGVDYQVDIP